jgi:hypothetical protein
MKKLTFSIERAELIEQVSNSQLSKVRMWIAREGENSHGLPISKKAISLSKLSLVGKPILCKYNKYTDSFEGHEVDETPVGCFIKESEIYEEEIDGQTWIIADGYIWSKYFPEVMRVFEKDENNSSKISMEIEIIEAGDNEYGSDGINLFSYMGVTLIGVEPAIKEAQATVLRFSEMVKETEDMLFSDKITIDNSKESATNGKWSNPGKKLYDPIMKADNKTVLINEAYGVIQDGWETSPSTKLGYPHHIVRNGKLILHISGTQAAFARGRAQNLTGKPMQHIINHLKNDLKLDSENYAIFGLTFEEFNKYFKETKKEGEKVKNTEKKVDENFTSDANTEAVAQSELNDKQAEVNKELADENKKKKDVENEANKEKMSDESETETEEMAKKAEEGSAKEEAKETAEEEGKEKAEEEAKDKEEMSADESANKEEMSDESKMCNYEEMYAEMCNKFAELEAKFNVYMQENEELKKFKADIEENEKMSKIEYTIQEAIGYGMPKEETEKFRVKAEEFSLENIHIWENEVKAETLPFTGKQSKKEGFTRIGLPFSTTPQTESEDMWDRYKKYAK